MQVISNRINDHIPNFVCELCGDELTEKEMKDIIIFIHGDIEHDVKESKAFKENMQTIYIHKSCMELILNEKFHSTWKLFFSNSL
ncbi:MAG: hypothetical protein ACFFBP_17855 [Promethearchaeota archaeon]